MQTFLKIRANYLNLEKISVVSDITSMYDYHSFYIIVDGATIGYDFKNYNDAIALQKQILDALGIVT